MPRFIDIDGGTPIAAAAEARQAIGADIYVNALEFGAVGDGTTDDTEALQSWISYLVENNRQGWLPNGTYKITDTIQAPSGYGWGIHGENINYTIIKQFADNTPIMLLGDTNAGSHTYILERLSFTYATAQPSTNTDANCITFQGADVGDSSTAYHCTFRSLRFNNCYYGFRYKPGAYGPWGCVFDKLFTAGISGGLLDATGSTGACPNNQWGHLTIGCSGAVGPIIKNWRGYNMTVGAIEFLSADQGAQLITTASGFVADIGSLKLEIGTYSASTSLFAFTGNYNVNIGDVTVGGSTAVFTPASGSVNIIQVGAGGGGEESHLDIGYLKATATSLSGGCYALAGGGAKRRTTVGVVDLENGWTLQNTGGSSDGNFIQVRSWVNDALSDVQGDADYTVSIGDPNVLHFNTAFTSQRTITLPSRTGNDLCSGLYYDLVFDGAINGANTAVIKQGSTTIRTQTADKKRLRYAWRRASSGGGQWVLVNVSELDADFNAAKSTDVQVFTTSGTWTKPAGAVAVRVRCIGPGGGGGAGARGPSGTALSGGGGGSAGGMSEMIFAASDLSSTVSVTVHSGGAASSGQTSDDSAGAGGGVAGGNTAFGSYLTAGRGQGGGGGGLAAAGAGGLIFSSGWGYGMQTGASGGAGSATGAAGAGGGSGAAAGGGGGGGGITAAAAATAGGAGGIAYSTSLSGGTSGSGSNGGGGSSSAAKGPGTGGGGGGGNVSGAGYNGGAGGSYGAGGGGGGASLNGSVSGGGGKGGDGLCIVTTYF